MFVYDCGGCGNLHPIEFDPRAVIDGSWTFTCPEEGEEFMVEGDPDRGPRGPYVRRVIAYVRTEA